MNAEDSRNQRLDSPRQAQDVVEIVDDLLAKAVVAGASDVHFEPTGADLKVKYRLDGVLNPVESLPAVVADNVVARLKVMDGLLTYRSDIPQEGRLAILRDPHQVQVDTEHRMTAMPIRLHPPIMLKLSPKGEGFNPPKR